MRSEFEELPGLRTTPSETMERWDFDSVDEEQIVLDAFVDIGFLERSSEGGYARHLLSAAPAPSGPFEYGRERR
jgi:hypothetical protein